MQFIRKSITSFIWPIGTHELRKFIPMAVILFCILFNYTALRVLRETFVVVGIGAEAVTFLLIWVALPASVLLTITYIKLLDRFGHEITFYVMTSLFVFVIAMFAYVFYPYEEFFHPNPWYIKRLAAEHPKWKWHILIYGKWTYALFFVFADLWSNVILVLLFWQFANQITLQSEAKRFYPTLSIVSSLSLIASGTLVKKISNLTNFVEEGALESVRSHQSFLQITIGIILVLSAVFILSYYYMHRCVLNDKQSHDDLPKVVPSIIESMKIIFSSRYLLLILIIVMGYITSKTIIENIWRATLKQLYTNVNDYASMMSEFSRWLGISSIVFTLLGSNIIRRFSWLTSAIITPMLTGITGVMFFLFFNFQDSLDSFTLKYLGATPLFIASMTGTIQILLNKGSKYSLFDMTKEMAYIPLEGSLKSKGKAAIDLVGNQIGESGSAFLLTMCLVLIPGADYISLSLYFMIVFVFIVVIWLGALSPLSREFDAKLKESEEKS